MVGTVLRSYAVLESDGIQAVDCLKQYAGRLNREANALYLAFRDPRVPWHVKAFVTLVASHTSSPLDLIPEFIPMLAYVEDLIITPLGILPALRSDPS